jgi:hypothetical protein
MEFDILPVYAARRRADRLRRFVFRDVHLLRAVAASGAAAAGIGVALRTGVSSNPAAQGLGHSHGQSDASIGPLGNATVSFGHWKIDPPLDRITQPAAPPRNVHFITPNEVKI